MEVITEEESGGGRQLFESLTSVLITLEYIVWIVYYIVSIIFISAEGVSSHKLWKYSVPKDFVEQQPQQVEFTTKVACYGILLSLSVAEIVAFCFTGRLHHDVLYFLLNMVLFSTVITSAWLKFNRKLSMEHKLTTILGKYDSKITIVLTTMGETLTLLRYIPQSFYLPSSALPDGSYWIAFFMRIIILIVIYVEPWVEEIEQEKVKEEEKTTEKKKEKNECFIACIGYLYRMRQYFLPSTKMTKIYFGLLIGLVGLDSGADFLSSYYSMKMLNSLQFESTEQKDAKQSSNMKLEFRWDFVVIYFAVQILQGNFIYSMKYYFRKQVEKASCCKLQMDIFSKLHEMSIRWHLENQATEVFSTMSSAPYILESILQNVLWMVPSVLGSIMALIFLINSYSFKLSSLVITSALVATAIDFWIARSRERSVEAADAAATEVRSVRAASFENFETVKYFTNEKYEAERYAEVYEAEEDQSLKGMFIYYVYSIGSDIFQNVSEMIVVLLVIKLIVDGEELSIGDYTYFLSVFRRIQNPFDLILSFYRDLQTNAVSAKKVLKILDAEPEIMDEPNASELVIDSSGGTIEFRNVDFSYVPERQILKKFNLTIPAGHTVAFVGHSGCGKSTLTKLIFRFYDPTGGEILVNGQSIRNVTCKSLRGAIGVVPQDIILFDDTIKENIKYGKVLTATDEEIMDAAKAACLHERIESFPDKYETEVGSRGLKLSGGEKQRLALARTVLKNPPILILDEATSSLDTETEKQIQTSTEALCKNRTTIIIAHRLSTIVNSDKIFVLQEGSIVETGTHYELLELNGIYTSMWNQQFNTVNPTRRPETPSKLVGLLRQDSEIRHKRLAFATRMQQTVWKIMTRRAISALD